MVLGLLDELQIFRQLCLIELLGLSTGLGLLELQHVIYPRLLTVWQVGVLCKLKTYGQIFGLVSCFLSNRQLWVVLEGKSAQEYSVNAGVPQGSIFGPTLFLLYINDLSDDIICNITIYADDTSFYSKCDQASDLWQTLELAAELESALWGTVNCGRKCLVDLIAGKNLLVLFDVSKNTDAIDVNMDGSVLEEKFCFKILGWLSLPNWIQALTLSLFLKLPPRKLEPYSFYQVSLSWGSLFSL